MYLTQFIVLDKLKYIIIDFCYFKQVDFPLQDKYFQARLYHEVGCFEERNKCALEFRQFELQHPCQSYQLSVNSF